MLFVFLQVVEYVRGNVNSLEFFRLRVLDVTSLGEGLEDRRPKACPRRFVPNWHIRITPAAVVQVVVPKLVRQGRAKEAVLLPNHQIEEVTQERAVLHGSSQHGVCSDRACAVPHESPKAGPHRLQATPDESGQPLGGSRSSSLKYVLGEDRVVPVRLVDAVEEQVGDDPALG